MLHALFDTDEEHTMNLEQLRLEPHGAWQTDVSRLMLAHAELFNSMDVVTPVHFVQASGYNYGGQLAFGSTVAVMEDSRAELERRS